MIIELLKTMSFQNSLYHYEGPIQIEKVKHNSMVANIRNSEREIKILWK